MSAGAVVGKVAAADLKQTIPELELADVATVICPTVSPFLSHPDSRSCSRSCVTAFVCDNSGRTVTLSDTA